MYYFLTGALTRRAIHDFRQYWTRDPELRDKLVDNIQGKYSFRERPQHAIIIKASSANHVRMSADNAKGMRYSYSYLTRVKGYPGQFLEWIVDDMNAVRRNGGRFPSPPGVYYVTVTDYDKTRPEGNLVTFEVEALLDIYDESPQQVDQGGLVFQVSQGSFVGESQHVVQMPDRIVLVEGTEYFTDPANGTVNLYQALPDGRYLNVDYRYRTPVSGPYVTRPQYSHHQAIPGVVLAFGRKIESGDRMAIVVSDRREPTAYAYGGRWDISLEIEVMSRDVELQEYICDDTLMYITSELYPRWSSEGLEITEWSFGGAAEEPYDDTAQDFFYTGSISMTVQVEWELHQPILGRITQVTELSQEQAAAVSLLSEEELASVQTNLQIVDQFGLEFLKDPFFRGRSETFEMFR